MVGGRLEGEISQGFPLLFLSFGGTGILYKAMKKLEIVVFELCHKVPMLYNKLYESAQITRLGGEHCLSKGNTIEAGEKCDN